MKLLPIVVGSVVFLSGCAGNLSVAGDQATLSGSPEGLRAMFDGMNGMISNGKASPDRQTAHWVARREQEKEKTKRHMAPSFLSSLFQRNGASNVTNLDVDTGSNELETFK
jgi:hypothetical protein